MTEPRRFGRFEILREIGKGAMGQVLLARDPKIDRPVAIKTIVLPPGVSPQEAHETSQRFLREAQAAGRLLHPNIVTIFDVGEDAGVTFIAMEYIEGVTLEAHTRPDNLLPLRRVQELISQTAAALDYAHENGIVHRDIKPANLMVVKGGQIKVTDFGLAKSPQANLTQAGVLLGTPSYMSPEQIQGQDLDGRSDLFSLGVVLYELLTGVRPFAGESISTIIYRVLYEDPRPPAAHNPALPSALNAVLEKALAKDRSQRHSSGALLAADLGKALAGLPPESLMRPLVGVTRTGDIVRDSRPTRPAVRRDAARSAPRRRETPAAHRAAAPEADATGRGRLHAPFKIAAAVLLAAAGLVFFPRGANRPEERASQIETRPVPQAPVSTAAIGGGAAGGAAQTTGGQVVIDVETDAAGAEIYLDSTRLAEPRVVLSLSDRAAHDIMARAGCRQAIAEMTAADLASFPGPLSLELAPREEVVPIASEPPGARILLDGKDTGRVTPATLPLSACDAAVITLEHAGFLPWTARHAVGDDFDALLDRLRAVTLDPVPRGSVLVRRPPEYDVEVFAGETRIGKAGEAFSLPEGKHRLTLRNPKYFVNETARVTVAGGITVSPPITLPGLGGLTVQAQPSNCKVYIDGSYVDVTPVLDLPIAAGGHRVRVVFVPTGAEQEVAVSVDARKTARVTVKF